MMPGQSTANRFKELCAEYHARPKTRYSDFDDFLVEKIERLEEEIAKKPLGQWCDRSENERLREEKAELLAALANLANSHAHLFTRCEHNPSHFDSYDIDMAEARDASWCAHAAIVRVTGAASPSPSSSGADEEPA